MTPSIKPIETLYAGCRFRSRLEARWAVFFDHLELPWLYELQGFHTAAGPYLPDFWLPTVNGTGAWFEVKPDDGTVDARAEALSVDCTVYVAFGMSRGADRVHHPQRYDGYIEMIDHRGWDMDQAFCLCPQCGRCGIQFGGRQGRICRHPGVDEEGEPGPDHPRLIAAYEAARSARFEHGERG